jgi:uncharacterized protein
LKKILLLSDSHSHIETKLNPYMEKADEIWHAGDFGSMGVVQWVESFGKISRAVWGNIDDTTIRNHYPEDNIFQVEDVKVWMTHIGGYPARYSPRVRKLFDEIQPMLFVCGHSHLVKLEQDHKYKHWVFNPGAAGNEGFHQVKTAISFEISENNISKVEVINLGMRGHHKILNS